MASIFPLSHCQYLAVDRQILCRLSLYFPQKFKVGIGAQSSPAGHTSSYFNQRHKKDASYWKNYHQHDSKESHRRGLRRSLQKQAVALFPVSCQRVDLQQTGKCHEQRTDITQMHASGGSWANWGKLWWQTISPVRQLLSIQLSTEAHYIQAWNDIWKRLRGAPLLHTCSLLLLLLLSALRESSPSRTPASASHHLLLRATLIELPILDLCILSVKTNHETFFTALSFFQLINVGSF